MAIPLTLLPWSIPDTALLPYVLLLMCLPNTTRAQHYPVFYFRQTQGSSSTVETIPMAWILILALEPWVGLKQPGPLLPQHCPCCPTLTMAFRPSPQLSHPRPKDSPRDFICFQPKLPSCQNTSGSTNSHYKTANRRRSTSPDLSVI